MTIARLYSPLRRDFVLGLLALSLLAGPLWAGILHVDDPAHVYDRAEVTTTESRIVYDGSGPSAQTMLSEDVICAETMIDFRACTFEGSLRNESIPTGYHSTSPANVGRESADYYAYVQLRDGVYEPTYVANSSAQRNGLDRIDMGLEPVNPDTALERVSIAADDDELSAVVAETARNGATTAREPVAVPETPIAIGDDTYYRVYDTGDVVDPRPIEGFLAFLLRYGAPVVGALLTLSVVSRLEVSVSYVGSDD